MNETSIMAQEDWYWVPAALFGGFVFWPLYRFIKPENLRKALILKVTFFMQLIAYGGIAALIGCGAAANRIDYGDAIMLAPPTGVLFIVASLAILLFARETPISK